MTATIKSNTTITPHGCRQAVTLPAGTTAQIHFWNPQRLELIINGYVYTVLESQVEISF